MSLPIALRDDFSAAALRQIAKSTKDAAQGRRLLALAEIYDGGTRTDAARIGGVGLQTVRDWVLSFNAAGPAGLIAGKAPGNPSKLDDAQRSALPVSSRHTHNEPGNAGPCHPAPTVPSRHTDKAAGTRLCLTRLIRLNGIATPGPR